MESQFSFLKNKNQALVLVILLIIIFFVFVLPKIDAANKKELALIQQKIKEKLENTNTRLTQIDKLICSKQCCKHTQWPVPKDMLTHDMTDELAANFIGTNMSCNLGNGSGCVCATKDDFDYLATRGTNGGTNVCK
jgi:hypothetical protein